MAASLGDAGVTDAGPDAASPEAELGALAKDEDEVFTHLNEACPKLAPP